MFDAISSFVAANQILFWGLVSIVGAIAVLSQASARFWVRDFWVRFPIFGDLAQLAKDVTKGSNGWMRAEEKLCAIYKPYVTLLPEDKFNERIEYMRKAGDLGRTPTPGWVIGLIALLVVAEGLGFSYILGSWMARDGSANTHTLLMFAIVFVLATILVALTHAAGHQYYRTSLLRSCFKRFKTQGGEQYSSKQVALKDPQSSDDHEPDYVQIVNRVAKNSGDRGSYAAGVIAIIAIAVIAITSTVMRWQNLEGELTRETVQQSEAAAGNPFDTLALPGAVTEPQQAADQKAKNEEIASTKVEGLSAFLMLGFIFVITQIVGMGAGYKYGFSGKETYKSIPGKWLEKDGAYADTGGISTYDTYWNIREPMVDLVNARLKDLQQRMEAESHEKLTLHKTFRDYLEEQQSQSNTTRSRINSGQQASSNKPVLEPMATGISAVEKAKTEIAVITDREAQMEYFARLSADVQDALKPWLKQRKEEEATRKEQQKELEDLF